MNQSPAPERPARPSLRTLFAVGAYGTIAATVAYMVSRGNPFVMLIVFIIIGVGFRLAAYLLIRHRGHKRPEWWRWL